MVGARTVSEWIVGAWTVGAWTVGEWTVGAWMVGAWMRGWWVRGWWVRGRWVSGQWVRGWWVHGGQRATFQSQFSPSAKGVLEAPTLVTKLGGELPYALSQHSGGRGRWPL